MFISAAESGVLGTSLLHAAADHRQTKIITLLLKYNANVLARNPNGQLPLHVAAIRGLAKCIPLRLVVPNGRLAINAQANIGRTPLHLCFGHKFIKPRYG
jgi:ankyrin repeat protein